MKILNLSLDNLILDASSHVAKRVADYGDLVDMYTIVVPSKINKHVFLNKRIAVYGSGGMNKIFQFFHIYKQASLLLKKRVYDLITLQDPYFVGFLGVLLAKKFDTGLEIQVHGWEKETFLRMWIAKRVLSKADSIRVVSNREKQVIKNKFGIAEKNIIVIPIYVEKNTALVEKPKRNTNNTCIFLTVGRLVSIKNILMQIESLPSVIKNNKDKNIQLWIVGEGPMENILKSKIKELQLNNHVILHGWKDKKELNDIYIKADCFLLTSNREGWPLVIMEAASHALPIIMPNTGSAQEFIQHNINGLVVEVGSLAELTFAMNTIVEDIDLRKKLGDAAKHSFYALPDKKEILGLYKKSWENILM